jgi:hypothetical protein
MRLVPKELRRAGMTGDVPYYGGRFSPAQAYAASHPSHRPPSPPHTSAPQPSPRQPVPASSEADTLAALQHLLDTDVIDKAEYQQLRARAIR